MTNNNQNQILEPIHPIVIAPNAYIPVSESFSFTWNWALHKVLSVATGFVSKIPGIGIFAGPYTKLLNYTFGMVIDELFPTEDSQGNPTTEYNKVFETLMTATAYMIDQKLDDLVKEKALNQLTGLRNALNEFNTTLYNLANNKSTDPKDIESLKQSIRSQFHTTNTIFVSSIPSFTTKNYEAILLSSFAQAANLHLILLRSVYQKGLDWGFTESEVESYYSNRNTGFLYYQNFYITQGMQLYQTALQSIKQKKPINFCSDIDLPKVDQNSKYYYNQIAFDNSLDSWGVSACQMYIGLYYGCDMNKQPGVSEKCKKALISSRVTSTYLQSIETWNRYNALKQNLQITALDIFSLFPQWDPKIYPEDTQSEFSREIYTDILGSPTAQTKDIDTISNDFLPQPRLFTWLQNLDFNIQNYSNTLWGSPNLTYNYINGEIITGINQTFTNTLGNTFVQSQGQSSDTKRSIISTSTNYINALTGYYWFEPRKIDLYKQNDFTPTFEVGTYNNDTEPFNSLEKYASNNHITLTSEQIRDVVYNTPNTTPISVDDHQISWIGYTPTDQNNSDYFVLPGKQLGALTVGWTSTTVDPKNTIQTDVITSIPATKSYTITDWAPGIVIKGPGFTGGDLVKLPKDTGNGKSCLKMYITYQTDPNRTYKCRIRYASTADTQIRIETWWNSDGTQNFVNLPATNFQDENNFKFSDFKNSDEITIKLDHNNTEFIVGNFGNSDLIIDKIEFIPTNPEPSVSDFTDPINISLNIKPRESSIIWDGGTSKLGKSVNINILNNSPNGKTVTLLKNGNPVDTAFSFNDPFNYNKTIERGFDQILVTNTDYNNNYTFKVKGSVVFNNPSDQPTSPLYPINFEPNTWDIYETKILWDGKQQLANGIDITTQIPSNNMYNILFYKDNTYIGGDTLSNHYLNTSLNSFNIIKIEKIIGNTNEPIKITGNLMLTNN